MQLRRAWVVAISLIVGGFGSAGGGGPDGPPPGVDAGVDAMVPPVFAGIDVLFVVNDSAAMRPLQQRLGEHMSGFLDALAAAEGHALDLHVGVVSTTVEEPVSPVALCRGTAGGELRPAACLTDGVGFAHTTAPNFSGTLAEAAACMVQVGDFGCPFEQPLQAMRRALDGGRPANAGFLRDDALLVVVFLTDEDDCASPDPAFYGSDPSRYGPLGSFRCFQFGARCDQPDPAALGVHTGCVAADDGVLFRVADYAAFLDTLKGGAGRVVVGGLVPPTEPVEVRRDEGAGRSLLTPLCADVGPDVGLQTWPSMRMHAFAQAFAAAGVAPPIGSICAADWAAQLGALAGQIADVYRE